MSNSINHYRDAIDHLHHYLSRFVPLSRQDLNTLLRYVEIREFEKKAVIIDLGQVERYLNIIAWGLVRKYLPLRNREITLQLAFEGHIVQSDLSFHYRTPSNVLIEALEPTALFSISYDSLQQLYEQFPKAERIGRLLISDLFIKSDNRYYHQLMLNTRERFLQYVRTHPQMLQRVPQKYIASYLNIKPETFSRLKHLVRPGRTLR